MQTSGQTESSVMIESRASDVISVNSSPGGSPEIEVAEIEDMNEEPGETKWRPLTSLTEAKATQVVLLDAFPYGMRNRDLRQTVAFVGQALEKSKLQSF